MSGVELLAESSLPGPARWVLFLLIVVACWFLTGRRGKKDGQEKRVRLTRGGDTTAPPRPSEGVRGSGPGPSQTPTSSCPRCANPTEEVPLGMVPFQVAGWCDRCWDELAMRREGSRDGGSR